MKSLVGIVVWGIFGACVVAATVVAQEPVRESAVKIHVSSRLPDFSRPWTKAPAKSSSGSGAIIAGKRILTNAHVVLYAQQIFVQFHESTDHHAAKVLAISPEMDLAVLEMEEPSLLDGRPSLEIEAGIPEFKSTVNVYGYPMGGDDQAVTEGIISRIDYARYSSNGSGLRIQVDAALNPGNSGGPAVVDGKIVGLVFSKISQADGIGYLIPSEEIEMFLEDIADGTYDGKPNLFDSMQTTENDALREKLRMTSDVSGIMVKDPYEETDAYPLKAWDVITAIGDHPIDNKGHIKIRDDLRLYFQYLLPKVTVAGRAPLTVFRDGEETRIEVPVRLTPEELLPDLNGAYPRHFIYGPMVFVAATKDLMRALGTKGLSLLAATESPLLYRSVAKPAFPGEELVVCLMLQHRRTKGYDNIPFGVVTHINDQSVKNLEDLVAILRDCKDEFITYRLGGRYETIVFRRDEMDETTEDVMDESGIRYQYSKDLAAIWNAPATPPVSGSAPSETNAALDVSGTAR